MARRTATNGDTTLTPQQAAAVDALAAGATVTAAAESIGAARQTVSEWLHHDVGFRAELNARRRELWEGAADRLRGLLPRALDVLAAALEDEAHQRWAAREVLKAAGAYGLAAPSGPTDPEGIDLEDQEREANRRCRAESAAIDLLA